jgi:hypothetical protein
LDENINQLHCNDLDASRAQKKGGNHYNYMSDICIDVENGFIRRFAVLLANILIGGSCLRGRVLCYFLNLGALQIAYTKRKAVITNFAM